jgi:hypothetical protein
MSPEARSLSEHELYDRNFLTDDYEIINMERAYSAPSFDCATNTIPSGRFILIQGFNRIQC